MVFEVRLANGQVDSFTTVAGGGWNDADRIRYEPEVGDDGSLTLIEHRTHYAGDGTWTAPTGRERRQFACYPADTWINYRIS